MLQNVGSVENKGIEFNIVSRNLTGKFKWTTTFNISANRNKVLALGLDSEAITDGVAESNITKVGYPIGMFYGNVFGGIYQSMEEIQALRNDPYSGLDDSLRQVDVQDFGGLVPAVTANALGVEHQAVHVKQNALQHLTSSARIPRLPQ